MNGLQYHATLWCWRFPLVRESLVEGSTLLLIYLFIYLFIVGGDQLTCTTSTLYVEISPQWVSDLRRLWTSVP